jgi:4-hydroxy-tetrahydrodipicolinate synthase
VPLLAYNIPSLVGYALGPPFVHRLAREGVLSGVKDTSGSIESVRRFLDGRPEGFAVLPGDDRLAAEAIGGGAPGAVMGLANIVPKLCTELVRRARAGERKEAAELGGLVEELAAVVEAGPFPSTVKYLSTRLRKAEVGYRAPYDPLSPEEEARVLERLAPLEARLAPFLGR